MRNEKGKRMRIATVMVALVLCLGMMGLASGCSSKQASSDSDGVVAFVDDLGREVQVPENVDLVVPSGHPATQFLLSLCPEKMASVSTPMKESEVALFGIDGLADLPVTGSAFGKKGDLNKETVAGLSTGKNLILVDTGEVQDGMVEDIDQLQDQLGVPCVFIATEIDSYDEAYTKLGELLGCEERAKKLADYSRNAYDEVAAAMDRVGDDRVRVAFIVGNEGVNAIAKTSFQGRIVDMIADNVVELEDVSGKGNGNPIDLEQLANWDPEVILFQGDSFYSQVGDMAGWQVLTAIENGTYYEVPEAPYCWLNNPPSSNQIIGMQWLARLLYPDQFDDSIADVTKSYYETFYQCELSDDEVAEIIENASIR